MSVPECYRRYLDDEQFMTHVRELGRASRRAQGLPEKITDPLVLDQCAALMGDYLIQRQNNAA